MPYPQFELPIAEHDFSRFHPVGPASLADQEVNKEWLTGNSELTNEQILTPDCLYDDLAIHAREGSELSVLHVRKRGLKFYCWGSNSVATCCTLFTTVAEDSRLTLTASDDFSGGVTCTIPQAPTFSRTPFP